MNFQKIKGNFFYKIILGKTGLIMPFKFADIGVQPDGLRQIKNETGICHSLKDFGGPAHVRIIQSDDRILKQAVFFKNFHPHAKHHSQLLLHYRIIAESSHGSKDYFVKKYVTYGNSCAIIIKKLCDMTALKWVNGMVEGDVRREKLLDILKNSSGPVSGSSLSRLLGVSRQVIVQDIALLRAGNAEIFATPKGYILYTQGPAKKYRRSFMVNHTKEQIVDELSLIVDNGGKVLNVIVAHDVYGQIQADLILENKQDVMEFYERMGSSKAGPLLQISNGVHIHTVEAASERILDNIERDLRRGAI